MRNIFKKYIFIFLIFSCLFFLARVSSAEILDSWKNPKAYRPKPVLFLHGFGAGNSQGWAKAKTVLSKYFSAYKNDLPYLEVIDFNDSNGSVDTYDTGKFNPQGNTDGWADKLAVRVKELLAYDKYGSYTNKLNLVCHSMGGLAAREFLTNPKYLSLSSYADKLIMTGTPNKGSPLATEANALSKIPKLGWISLVKVDGITASAIRDYLEFNIYLLQMDINGEAVDDMDITGSGSGFLNQLNLRRQPQDIDFYSIVGISGNLMNWILFKDWYGGDGVVSEDSQLGTKAIVLKDSTKISAPHSGETTLAVTETNNQTLKFLDSNIPRLDVTSPNPDITTEIFTYNLRIQGKLFNEYLPANSILKIQVRRKEAYTPDYDKEGKFFYPSDLWIPNNSDSPVAEFDEEVTFSETGNYEVTLAIINPAFEIVVFPKTIKVKVSEKIPEPPGSIMEIPLYAGSYLAKSGAPTYERALSSTPKKGSGLLAGQLFSNSCCYSIFRTFLLFNTAGLSGKQIISVKLIFNYDFYHWVIRSAWGQDFYLEAYTADWGASFGTEDWDSYLTLLGSSLITKPPYEGSTATLEISPQGINTQGNTKLALISKNDRLGLIPPEGEAVAMVFVKLRIEYR